MPLDRVVFSRLDIAFSTEFPTELLEWGRKLSGIFGVRKFWLVGFNGKIRGKKSGYRKNCSAVDVMHP